MSDYQLHAPEGANKKKRIVGRGQGSGLGTTAGKGNKGQQSRSGGKTYPGFEGGQMPLYRRLPMRGFSNYPFRKEWQIVNVADLEAKYKAGEKVDAVSLLLKGLVKKPEGLIKVLGKGSISIALEVSVDAVSAGAKTKIEAAGGKVETPVAVASAGKA
ncbi:MAG: 50S ribosomal protein L15 [Spirochaetia bacterium]|jgi:large subunit ribosomal protein L15|uniref:Large ribosomal subunit protein uL15 n=2 Tax=root TaxID=1 RepID=A0A652ZS80_9SPIR|nr:50S ribosomal protein L15 [Spirochaetia bacterium]MDD3819823.1 50S ribosomal protein L15 [Spirochaetales bacterium]NLX45616.1 50S ribosomal protein L15 [Treponema sp.]VBB38630.1 50S ribosomal subunit protein L15 [uncultured Spirochaetota bacterium]MCE1209953.1 50S ribosomal protein L15 [Spirochaetia bacterium]